ncbi:MAG: hypothetical protein KGL39_52220 [Patescibacteria group bacterium]|nr:hypothetical protein [Patescibacteria group bacterium]
MLTEITSWEPAQKADTWDEACDKLAIRDKYGRFEGYPAWFYSDAYQQDEHPGEIPF